MSKQDYPRPRWPSPPLGRPRRRSADQKANDRAAVEKFLQSSRTYSRARAQRVVAALRYGLPLARAALYAGISLPTLKRWIEVAQLAEDGELAQFYRDVMSARSELEHSLVGVIVRAAEGGAWQAAAWLLERLFPQRYVKLERREIVGVDHRPLRVVIDVGAVDGPQLRESDQQLPRGSVRAELVPFEQEEVDIMSDELADKLAASLQEVIDESSADYDLLKPASEEYGIWSGEDEDIGVRLPEEDEDEGGDDEDG